MTEIKKCNWNATAEIIRGMIKHENDLELIESLGFRICKVFSLLR